MNLHRQKLEYGNYEDGKKNGKERWIELKQTEEKQKVTERGPGTNQASGCR